MLTFFKCKAYGSITIGERGEFVIPLELRKALNIKPGDQLVVFAKLDEKVISLMPSKDFSQFLERASKLISKLKVKLLREIK